MPSEWVPPAISPVSKNRVLINAHAPHGWMPVPELPGFYASAAGEIWSAVKGGVKRQSVVKGYAMIWLWRNGRDRRERVHRLVALAFHGKPPSSRHTVDHINRNPLDNRAENLRWASHEEQARNRDDFLSAAQRVAALKRAVELICVSPGYTNDVPAHQRRAIEALASALSDA